MTMRRTQIYLTEEEDRLLVKEAERTGRSKAALIREAIDRVFGESSRRAFEKVLRETAGAWADLPDEEFERLDRLRHGWSERQREFLDIQEEADDGDEVT